MNIYKQQLLKLQKEVIKVFSEQPKLKNKLKIILFIKDDISNIEIKNLFKEIINNKLKNELDIKNKQLELCKSYFSKNNNYNLHLNNNIQKIYDKYNYYSYESYGNRFKMYI